MSYLTPGGAIQACEQALRDLMAQVFAAQWGTAWLEHVSTTEQRQAWQERAATEQAKRLPRGVTQVPPAGLAYADLYALLTIAEKNWEPLAEALGKKKEVAPLLKRLDDLRNTIAHSRPLIAFEQDLVSGIAGDIRNRVTIYMSSQDPTGEYYPRIDVVRDHLGNELLSPTPGAAQSADTICETGMTLHPGDTVTFEAQGTDPQGRRLAWYAAKVGTGAPRTDMVYGDSITLSLPIHDTDVREGLTMIFYMRCDEAQYHRLGHTDGDSYVIFTYNCRPRLPGR